MLPLSAHLEGYLEDLMDEAILAINKDLSPANPTGRFANPSIGNINNLFAFLGMGTPCDSFSRRSAGNAAVKKNINELVQTRNRIAHGGTGETVSRPRSLATAATSSDSPRRLTGSSASA